MTLHLPLWPLAPLLLALPCAVYVLALIGRVLELRRQVQGGPRRGSR